MKWDVTHPELLLRAEGAAALGLALVLYSAVGATWWLFVLLILVPDISLLAYLADQRIGAMAYNTVHTYVIPAVLFAMGFLAESQIAMAVALVWIAHVGADRLLGFGLKYSTGRKPTHLQRVGE